MSIIARSTPGFSGADLANLVNEAALYRRPPRPERAVAQDDFEVAKDKVLMGTERKIADHQRRGKARHGITTRRATHWSPTSMPERRPAAQGNDHSARSRAGRDDAVAGGRPAHLFEGTTSMSNIAVFMGGRVAEEIKLDRLTTGAGNDFERATDMARKMVTEWGMSKSDGSASPSARRKSRSSWDGRSTQHRDYSEVDRRPDRPRGQVRRISHGRLQPAPAEILEEQERTPSRRLAEALLEREVHRFRQRNRDPAIKGDPLPALSRPAAADVTTEGKTAVGRSCRYLGQVPGTRAIGVLPEPGKQPA